MIAGQAVVEVAGGKIPLLSGGEGPPLLVLSRDIGACGWLPLFDQLASKFSVFVPTYPGFAGADVPSWARNVRDLAALLQWLVRDLKIEKPTVLGLGFGGWIAAEMMTLAPGAFRSAVLVSPMGLKPEQGEIFDQFLLHNDDYVRACFHDVAKFKSLFGDPPTLDQREMWEINREMVTRVAWKPYMFNPALPFLLRGCDTPTLLVWGRADQIVPLEVGELYRATLRDARLEVIENCGHVVEIEQPARLGELIASFAGRGR